MSKKIHRAALRSIFKVEHSPNAVPIDATRVVHLAMENNALILGIANSARFFLSCNSFRTGSGGAWITVFGLKIR